MVNEVYADALEVLYYLKTALNKVSSVTVSANCFNKAGFKNGDSTSFEWNPEDYLSLSTIVQMERCADEINIAQENLENYITTSHAIAATEEISLNT